MTELSFRKGAYRYRVILVDDLRNSAGERLIGQLDSMAMTISILRSLSPEARLLALGHEIVHLILEQAGRAEVNNEGLLHALAYGILEVWRFDEDVRRWALGESGTPEETRTKRT